MCRVPAFVVEQEHGDRLAGGGRLEPGGEVEPATAFVDVEHQRVVARVPVTAPTVSVAHSIEPVSTRTPALAVAAKSPETSAAPAADSNARRLNLPDPPP